MLQLKNFSVFVGKKKILNNINYQFKKNHVYCLMGPNGSGKSTLAYGLMGHPDYQFDPKTKIYLDQKEITDLLPEKRAQKGIFLSFQTPLSLSGVTVFQLLRTALSGKKDPLLVKNQIDKYAEKLKIKKELLNRSLNDGASGGERKKLELLQAAVLSPRILILDEIDTGVDIDALKTIGHFLESFKKNKIVILITHYSRILRYINSDRVLILVDGHLVKEGKKDLIEEIDRNGYPKTDNY